jgi:hypothetical protein
VCVCVCVSVCDTSLTTRWMWCMCVEEGGGESKPCHKVIGMGEDVVTEPCHHMNWMEEGNNKAVKSYGGKTLSSPLIPFNPARDYALIKL